LLLVTLPPAPPVAVAPFWLKLQAALPQRRTLKLPSFSGYRRMSVAFALAAATALAATVSALAAPSALPDNPLYPVKHLEEDLRLALTPSNERLNVQLQLASERLREAQAMVANHKPLLAENSLRGFEVILNNAAAALKNAADLGAAKASVDALRVKLTAVERENANRDDDAAGVKRLVADASDELDRIEQPETVATPPLVVTTGEPTPTATPEATPQPTPWPTPRPTPTDDGDHHGHHG
jgi:hypothetical protein